MYQAKLNYLGWENLIEWTMYAFSLVLVIDQSDCQKETNIRSVSLDVPTMMARVRSPFSSALLVRTLVLATPFGLQYKNTS